MGRPLDLSGQKYGRLTVIKRADDYIRSNGHHAARWLCKCNCGNYITVLGGNLRRASGTKSCGCLQREINSHLRKQEIGTRFIDLSGQKFYRLTVIDRAKEYVDTSGRHRFKYYCLCDCGQYTYVKPSELKSGKVKSCGCLHREVAAFCGKENTRHGGSRANVPYEENRLYNIWRGMRQRCENPNKTSYKYWGGRGIRVCEEWHDFEPFQKWALSNGYDGNLSIDRIDANGNYEPSNCRWCTKLEQNNNQRSNRFVEVDGVKHTIAEWSRISGIKYATITGRLDRGWEPADAIFTEARKLNAG